ncbi:MAG: 50S ribosomal protein L3 [Microgenomates group bacterium]
MISGFVVKKSTMTNIYTPEGKRIAVTKCIVSPLTVTQIKSTDKDGYAAIQVAYGAKKNLNKAVSSKISKLKLDIYPRFFKEFDLTSETIPEIGSNIAIDSVFAVGDKVAVYGITKGRGFAGVIKRYGFRRQPVSGGQSDRVRAPGAIGAQTPGKVIKGKKMPGHMGNVRQYVKGLQIFSLDAAKNEIVINGPVPGHVNSWITICKA